MNDTNVPLSVELTGNTKADFCGLLAEVYAKDMDIGNTILMLTPSTFSAFINALEYDVYGSPEAIQDGRIPKFAGFKSVVVAPNMAEGWKGALVDANAIGVAARYLKPMDGAYVNAWQSSDPISGMPIGFREGTDLATGVRYLAGEYLIGASILRDKGIVSIK